MSYSVVPVAEAHIAAPHRALDIVARDKRFPASTQAPPFEKSLAFHRGIIATDLCQRAMRFDDAYHAAYAMALLL